MVVLGLVLLIIGLVASIPILTTIGAILVVFLWSWWFPELRLAKSFDEPDLAEGPAKESVG